MENVEINPAAVRQCRSAAFDEADGSKFRAVILFTSKSDIVALVCKAMEGISDTLSW